MNRYKIPCTKEQTRKAFELGAPIEFEMEFPVNLDTFERSPYPDIKMGDDGEPILIPPTVEEIIGWLEEQKGIEFTTISKAWGKWYFYINLFGDTLIGDEYQSRKEATLKALNTALDYLIKNKE